MSDEKLVKEFIEKMQPQNKSCFILNDSGLTVLHEYTYCQCDMIKSFEAGLKAEREKSQKLVEVLKQVRIQAVIDGLFARDEVIAGLNEALKEYEEEG